MTQLATSETETAFEYDAAADSSTQRVEGEVRHLFAVSEIEFAKGCHARVVEELDGTIQELF